MTQKADYDLFLSYAHADRERVRPLAAGLEGMGLRVWFDESKIPDFAAITKNISTGLLNSRAVLVYYSSSYPKRRACQWELTAALLAARGGSNPEARVLVVNPEPRLEHIHPVELRDTHVPKAPGTDEDLEDLLGEVRRHLESLKGPLAGTRQLEVPPWFGRTGVGSRRFVGRLVEFWRLHSALHAPEAAIVTGSTAPAVAQVTGLGGIGKSLLVEEYALRFGAAFPGGIYWLRAYGHDDSETGLSPEEREAHKRQQIRSFAAGLELPVEDRSAAEILASLAQALGRRGPSLWVVDDLPSGLDAEAFRRWLAPHPMAKTVITTRSREYAALGESLALDVLSKSDALQLLTSHREPEGRREHAAARSLVDDFGGHALALEVAGAALRASAGVQSFSEFREALASLDEDELEFAACLGGVLPSGHEKSIASTLLRSIERLGEEGLDFLRLASRLAVAPIPARLVQEVFEHADGLERRAARRRTSRALDQADELSLAECSGADGSARTVHTLVSRTLRFRDPDPDRTTSLREAAFAALTDALESVAPAAGRERVELQATHARELVRTAASPSEVRLAGCLGRYDFDLGDYASAEVSLRAEATILERELGKDHTRTLAAIDNLAQARGAQGDLAGARTRLEDVTEILREKLGPRHPQTLASMNNLATVLRDLGDRTQAQELLEEALEVLPATLGEAHELTLSAMSNLAETLTAQGALPPARRLLERALPLFRRTLGPDHLKTLTCMANLGANLHAQGDLAGARELLQENYDRLLATLSEAHPKTLSAVNNLALAIGSLGDLHGARDLHERALELRRQILGNTHPETLASISNLASTLDNLGEYEMARDLGRESLDLRRQILGAEHPDTLVSMNNLATVLGKLGDREGARDLHQKTLAIFRRTLGDEHPQTLTSMNNLAATLQELGDLRGALDLQRQVLSSLRRYLGTEHPNTSVAAWNLFRTALGLAEKETALNALDDLLWLLDQNPVALGPNQQQIRTLVAEFMKKEA